MFGVRLVVRCVAGTVCLCLSADLRQCCVMLVNGECKLSSIACASMTCPITCQSPVEERIRDMFGSINFQLSCVRRSQLPEARSLSVVQRSTLKARSFEAAHMELAVATCTVR